MKTYEMVALAEKDGCTYSVDDMRYNKKLGFHDSSEEEWPASAWSCINGLQDLVLCDGWRKLEPKKLTRQQISKILGYDFEIVG